MEITHVFHKIHDGCTDQQFCKKSTQNLMLNIAFNEIGGWGEKLI